ncbi:hypothetical protein EC988_003475, partial [Linderina pennispora]
YLPLSVISDPNQIKSQKQESSSWWYSLFGSWGRSRSARNEIPAVASPAAALPAPRAFAQPAIPSPVPNSNTQGSTLAELPRAKQEMSEADVTNLIVSLSGPVRQYLLRALTGYQKILKTIDPKSIANVIRGPLGDLRKNLEALLSEPAPQPTPHSKA